MAKDSPAVTPYILPPQPPSTHPPTTILGHDSSSSAASRLSIIPVHVSGRVQSSSPLDMTTALRARTGGSTRCGSRACIPPAASTKPLAWASAAAPPPNAGTMVPAPRRAPATAGSSSALASLKTRISGPV
eukprot:scaffold2854_cov116-Isochrysis_galbana.AAC.12